MQAKLLVLLVTLAFGCALGTTPITMESGKPVPPDRVERSDLTEPSADRTAKVSFLRDSGFAGGACTHSIEIDGKTAFGLRPGEYQTVYLTPGPHDLGLRIPQGICPAVSLATHIVLRDREEKTYRVEVSASGPVVSEVGESGSSAASEPQKAGCDSVSTPGNSLAIREESRTKNARGTQVTYRIASSGFPASASSPLWYGKGDSCMEMWAAVGADGAVKVLGAETLIVEQYVSGEPVDLTLKSGDSSAAARVVPFPIEASRGDYRISVEVMSKTGALFFLTGTGFQPNEPVEVVSEFEGERLAKRVAASPTGNLGYPLIFQKGDDGKAKATVTGKGGSVSVEYAVGKDALVVR